MKSKYLSIICATFVVWLLPVLVGAAEPIPPFQPLVGIPGVDADSVVKDGGFGEYINALYRLSISIAALLAVVKIVAAGAKYMLSDIVTHKEDAKKDIEGALIGLLVIIGAVIILNTVNTDITKNSFVIATTTIDGSGADFELALDEFLAQLKSEQEKKCATADPTKGEVCATEPCAISSVWLSCKNQCDAWDGIYNPAMAYTLNQDYCTYIIKPPEGGEVEAGSKEECEARPDYVWKEETTIGRGGAGKITTTSCTYTPRTMEEIQQAATDCVSGGDIWNGSSCEEPPEPAVPGDTPII